MSEFGDSGLDNLSISHAKVPLLMIHRRAYPNLRMYLQKTGTSQRELARRLGIDPSYVSHFIRGTKSPSLRLAAKIARETNIPIETMLHEQAS